MRKSVPFLVLGLFLAAGPAAAQDKGAGLGVILGEPTGLSAKVWMSRSNALDFAAAWAYEEESAFHFHADYLFHIFNLFPPEELRLPLYFGLGGRVKMEQNSVLGVRIPVGLSCLIKNAPIDIFVELVPILELVPATDFAFNGGIGARFFFGGGKEKWEPKNPGAQRLK